MSDASAMSNPSPMSDQGMTNDYEKNRSSAERRDERAPFDTSDLATIPGPTKEDPPYRNWWVVGDPDDR